MDRVPKYWAPSFLVILFFLWNFAFITSPEVPPPFSYPNHRMPKDTQIGIYIGSGLGLASSKGRASQTPTVLPDARPASRKDVDNS